MFDRTRFNGILAKRRWPPWIVFVVCVALTLVVFLDARDSDRQRLWLHLKADVEDWSDMLKRDVEINLRDVTRAVVGSLRSEHAFGPAPSGCGFRVLRMDRAQTTCQGKQQLQTNSQAAQKDEAGYAGSSEENS